MQKSVNAISKRLHKDNIANELVIDVIALQFMEEFK